MGSNWTNSGMLWQGCKILQFHEKNQGGKQSINFAMLRCDSDNMVRVLDAHKPKRERTRSKTATSSNNSLVLGREWNGTILNSYYRLLPLSLRLARVKQPRNTFHLPNLTLVLPPLLLKDVEAHREHVPGNSITFVAKKCAIDPHHCSRLSWRLINYMYIHQ